MPSLKITITAPLSDDALDAFRDRHEIEGIVLQIIDGLDDPARVTVACEVEAGEWLRQKRRRRVAKAAWVPASPANGEAADTDEAPP